MAMHLRISLLGLLLLIFVRFESHLAMPSPSGPSNQPNVILIIADQMRGDALGILGHPDVQTPNLDRMANGGVLFSNFFVNNPVCVPSRMSLHSGRYPHEHGSISNKESVRFTSLDGTLLGYFKEKGYRLGWFGKDNHAYDRSVLNESLDANSSRRREAFRAYQSHTAPHWYSHTPWPNEQLFPVLTTNDAISFIVDSDDRPFFTVLSLFDPHPPYFAPAAYVANYPPNQLTLPTYTDPSNLSSRLANQKRAMLYDTMTESDLRGTLAHYYAAIEWGIDAQVGRLLDALQENQVLDNTIIIFTSEHGDFMGEFGMIRKGMFLYDALLHVPFILHAPGHIPAGHRSEVLAQGVDLYPTLLDLLGDTAPSSLPGRSLIPYFNGSPEINADHFIFAGSGYGELPPDYFDNPEIPYYHPEAPDRPLHTRIYDHTMPPRHRTAMLRTQDWKLILSETQPPELYDMRSSQREEQNVAGSEVHADRVQAMTKQLKEIWDWD